MSDRTQPRRVAVLSVHTSPLDQPGTGDAGGLNVYVVNSIARDVPMAETYKGVLAFLERRPPHWQGRVTRDWQGD